MIRRRGHRVGSHAPPYSRSRSAPPSPRAALAQGRTDVVTLANGDRITGEVLRLERGRLEFKTDDAGTLSLEWDKLVSLVAARIVEVVTDRRRRFVGTLAPAAARAVIAVATPAATVPLRMLDVALIRPIGRSFWRKLDGSFDAGFSYTQSSGIAQLNLNCETIYRKPASQGRVAASITLTRTEEIRTKARKRDRAGRSRHARDLVPALSVAALVRLGGGPVRIEREPRHPPAFAGRWRDRPAPGQQQPGAGQGRRRAGGQRRARRRRGADAQNVEALLLLRRVVLHLRSAEDESRSRLRYYPSLSEAGPPSRCSSMAASGASCGRTSSWR